jgi:hypothetical protein
MSALMAAIPMPTPPAAYDWVHTMPAMPAAFGMMGNDTYGDCVCAMLYHGMQVWSFHGRGTTITEPDADVLQLYHVWNPPPEDDGCVEQDVLKYAYQTGAPILGGVSKLLGFIEIDPRNTADIDRGIWQFGGVCLGINVPRYLRDQNFPAVWDLDPAGDQTIIGGHAIFAPSYDTGAVGFLSWGQKYLMTKRFFTKFVDEVYGCAHPWWLTGAGKTPLGLSQPQWLQLMRAL